MTDNIPVRLLTELSAQFISLSPEEELQATRDYFWSFSTQEKYLPESTPEDFTLGQVTESADWLRQLMGHEESTPYLLVWVADIVRGIASGVVGRSLAAGVPLRLSGSDLVQTVALVREQWFDGSTTVRIPNATWTAGSHVFEQQMDRRHIRLADMRDIVKEVEATGAHDADLFHVAEVLEAVGRTHLD